MVKKKTSLGVVYYCTPYRGYNNIIYTTRESKKERSDNVLKKILSQKEGRWFDFEPYSTRRGMVFFAIAMMMISFMISSEILGYPVEIKEKAIFTDELKDMTYNEVLWFMQEDQTDKNKVIEGEYVCRQFALDTIKGAEKYGLRGIYVIVFSPDYTKAHAIVAFNTTDRGMVFFEPQTDKRVNPSQMDIWD